VGHEEKIMGIKTFLQDAKSIAKEDSESNADITHIYLCSKDGDEEIKLLEVAYGVEPIGENEKQLSAIGFDKDNKVGKEIFHNWSVVLVSEEDFKGIVNGTIRLPKGWVNISKATILFP